MSDKLLPQSIAGMRRRVIMILDEMAVLCEPLGPLMIAGEMTPDASAQAMKIGVQIKAAMLELEAALHRVNAMMMQVVKGDSEDAIDGAVRNILTNGGGPLNEAQRAELERRDLNLAPGNAVTQTQSAVVLENLISQFLFNKAADAGTTPAPAPAPLPASGGAKK